MKYYIFAGFTENLLITPVTSFGKFIASFVMIIGYGVIAVPTGIVTFEIATATRSQSISSVCNSCGVGNHDPDAKYCKACGAKLG